LMILMSTTIFYLNNMSEVNGSSFQMDDKVMMEFAKGMMVYGMAFSMAIPFLMGMLRKGRTVGRQFNSLVITSNRGKVVPIWRLLVRFVAKVITVYIGLGIGLIFMLLNKDHRAFHDLIAGTKVVEIEQPDAIEVIAVNDDDNYDPKTGKLMEDKLAS